MEKKTFWVLLGAWLVICSFYICVQSASDPGMLGMPLDDSWIHLSFAKNLAERGVFGINPGEASNGSTAPLWTVLLSLGCWLGMWPGLFARLGGALFVLLSSMALYRLTHLLTQDKRTAFLSALFSLCAGRFMWGGLSGMEIPLFSFLMCLGLIAHERAVRENRISFGASCLFGFASLARPEAHLLFVLAFLDLAWRARFRLKEVGPRLVGYAVVYILFSLPYIIFSWILTGRPLCGSYYSKMAFLWVLKPWDYLFMYFHAIFMDNPFLAIPMVVGLRVLWARGQRLIPLWLTALPLCSAFVAPLLFQHSRYNIPLIPLYVMAGLIGLSASRWRWLKRTVVVMSLVWSLYFFQYWPFRYACDISSINQQQVRVALWLKDHAGANEGVAVNDVGAISFLSGRRVVDLCGIMDTKILKIMRYGGTDERRREMLRHYLAQRGIKYLAIYSSWFPWIVADPALEKVYQARVENNTAAGCDTMEVYYIR